MVVSRPPILHAPASLTTPSPSLSTVVSSEPYVIGLARLPTSAPTYAVSTSPPSSAIHLYTSSATGLTRTLSFHIGGNGPSAILVAPNLGGRPMLLSSQQHDGRVKVWDERQGARPVLEFLAPKNRGILSFDSSSDGLTLAAGTDLQSDDASIFYWDPRNCKQLQRTHSFTHSDDITALHFHPTRTDILLSASTDGLLSTSDALETDEDEAVQAVENWGCSISRAGWGPDNRVWAASDMETLGVWSGDLNLVCDFGDVRNPALPGSRWKTDYLIDAVGSSGTTGPCGISGLAVFLGSNSGDIAIAHVADANETNVPTWTVRAVLRRGHADSVVRSVLWDNNNGVLLSGDETGRLVAWRLEPDTDVEMADASAEALMDVGGTKRGRSDDQENRTRVISEEGFVNVIVNFQ